MHSDTSDHDHDASRNGTNATNAGPSRLQTVMSWHPADAGRVRQAFAAALEALHERAESSRLILHEPHAYGLADPTKLRHQIDADHSAASVIRTVLGDATAPDPR